MCLLGRDFYDDVMHLFLLVIPKTPVALERNIIAVVEKRVVAELFRTAYIVAHSQFKQQECHFVDFYLWLNILFHVDVLLQLFDDYFLAVHDIHALAQVAAVNTHARDGVHLVVASDC